MDFGPAERGKNMEQNVSWVFAMPLGEFTMEDNNGEVIQIYLSEALIGQIAHYTNLALAVFVKKAPENSTPYRFPVLIEHEEDGRIYGEILETKLTEAEGKNGLWVKVAWHKETFKEIEDDKIKFVSVGVSSNYLDEYGNRYPVILTELSLTTFPRMKCIGAIQDTLRLELSERKQMMKKEEMAEGSQPEENKAEEVTVEEEVTETEEVVEEPSDKMEELKELKEAVMKIADRLEFLAEMLEEMNKPKEEMKLSDSPKKKLNFSESTTPSNIKPASQSDIIKHYKEQGLSGPELVTKALSHKQ